MSKFSKTFKKQEVNITTNIAGGKAYKESSKLELVSLLLTSFAQGSFYREESAELERLRELVATIPDKQFIAKAGIYARNEFGMRSITHILAGEIAKNVKGEEWTKNYFEKQVRRADDITEILGYYTANYGKPIPNSMKKGLAKAFNKFDGYQLAKYRNGNALVDAINLLHPKGNEKNREALAQLMKGELKNTNTWEAKLSEAGKITEDETSLKNLKASAWKELIREKKLGYFALLRNLRNILEQADKETISLALEALVDENSIKHSSVLPFRFLTAMKEIKETNFEMTRQTIVAISKAIEISLNNVPKFEGKTLIALDVSGSMSGKPSEIGGMFASVLFKSNDSDLLTFDNTSRFINLNPLDSVITIRDGIKFTGGGTNFHSIFEILDKEYDRIIILSDMQGWIDGSVTPKITFERYKQRTNCNPFIYSFDLAGLGTLQFPEEKVFCLVGFSDKIFDVMSLLEQDKDALINKIESIII